MSEDGNSEYDLNTSSDEDSDQDFGEDEADGLAADGSIAGEILINDYWNPDDYDAIDLGQVKKPDPVDADDVARFQERVRDGVDAGERRNEVCAGEREVADHIGAHLEEVVVAWQSARLSRHGQQPPFKPPTIILSEQTAPFRPQPVSRTGLADNDDVEADRIEQKIGAWQVQAGKGASGPFFKIGT
ncbi:unnamed protein product [Zymoseptoria tritici ST99CH_3D1]|nr:unnamed protein product [Zymoseptoria tritici ST99CH_3D1]